MKFRSFCNLLLVLATGLAVSACSGSETPAATNANQPGQGAGVTSGQNGGQRGRGGAGGAGGARGGGTAISIRTSPIQRISIQRVVDLSGSLVSLDQVRVSSEVDGVIKDVPIEMGREVRAGQVLVSIDTRELEFALQRAESALRQTEAQLGIDSTKSSALPTDDQIAAVRTAIANRDDAKATFARAEELSSKGLMTKADHDTAETRVKVTEAQLQTALENSRSLRASLQDRRAAYELAKKKVADAEVRAPAAGIISERLVQKGEYLRANTQVATIVQISPLKLQTAVQEKYAQTIKPGLTVQFSVESYPGETFTGKVANISPSITQTSRTFPIEILVDNSNRKLKPGFFAKGSIFTQKDENVMAVPEDAVALQAGVASVYLIQNGTVLKQQNIIVGEHVGTNYEVLSGLNGDETVATSNLAALVAGGKVTSSNGGGTGEGAGARRGGGGNGARRGGATTGNAGTAEKTGASGASGGTAAGGGTAGSGGAEGGTGRGGRGGRGRGNRQGGTQ